MVHDVVLDIADPAADRNRFLNIILIPAGCDILQKLFGIMLIIDQDNGLRRIDRVVDPSHEDNPQDHKNQIDCRQLQHRRKMSRKLPAPDQGKLDIGNDICANHGTYLRDNDILNAHISDLQRPEQLRHQKDDQGIETEQNPVAAPPVKHLNHGPAVVFLKPDIREIGGLQPDHKHRRKKHDQAFVSLSVHRSNAPDNLIPVLLTISYQCYSFSRSS